MTEARKKDHIALSFSSVPDKKLDLSTLSYEPLFSAHPTNDDLISQKFMGYDFGMPLWVSSMTGGPEKAKVINENLARACGEFQLGMGLGSCRPLLDGDERFNDFNVKHLMGTAPLFTNFGIAQLEELVDADELHKVNEITGRLKADGVVIHVNPLQEWFQPEGDHYKKPAIETIAAVCDVVDTPIIVKEVGQGMGPMSLKALMDLPIAAIELAAYGGTNFSILERLRREKMEDLSSQGEALSYIGHTAEQMVGYLNDLKASGARDIEIIISGGIKDPVSGHVLKEQLQYNAIIGMASTLLKHAMGDYEDLQTYLNDMKECFKMSKAFIKGGAS